MPKGFKHSEESRRKMSEAAKGNKSNLGRKFTAEHRRKISEALKGHVGIKPSEETRKKISEAQKGNHYALGTHHSGYKHTEESKKHLREINLGKKHSAETKRKISEISRNISAETRRKISEAMKGNKYNLGKKASALTKRKQSEAHKGERAGENHYRWMGGKTATRVKQWKSPEYQKWRRLVFGLDAFICPLPGLHNKKLEAHHILTVHNNPELIFNVDNGITLCEKHHESIKGKEHLFVEQFTKLVEMRFTRLIRPGSIPKTSPQLRLFLTD